MAVIIPAFIPRSRVDRYTQQQVANSVPQPLGINSPGVSGLDDGWKSVYVENPEYKKARGGGGGSSPLTPEAEPVDASGKPIPKFIKFRGGDPIKNAPKDANSEGVILNTAPVQLFNADGTPVKQMNAFQQLDDMYVVDSAPTSTKDPSLIPQVVGKEELPYITGEKMELSGSDRKQIGTGQQNIASITVSPEYVIRDPQLELQKKLTAQAKPGEDYTIDIYDKSATDLARQKAKERWNEQNSQMQIAQAKLMMENPGVYGTPEQIAARDAEIAKSGLGDVPTIDSFGQPIPDSIRARMRPGDSFNGAGIVRGSAGAPPRLQPLPTLGMTPFEEPGPLYKPLRISKDERPVRSDTPRGPVASWDYISAEMGAALGTAGKALSNGDVISEDALASMDTGRAQGIGEQITTKAEMNFKPGYLTTSQYGGDLLSGPMMKYVTPDKAYNATSKSQVDQMKELSYNWKNIAINAQANPKKSGADAETIAQLKKVYPLEDTPAAARQRKLTIARLSAFHLGNDNKVDGNKAMLYLYSSAWKQQYGGNKMPSFEDAKQTRILRNQKAWQNANDSKRIGDNADGNKNSVGTVLDNTFKVVPFASHNF